MTLKKLPLILIGIPAGLLLVVILTLLFIPSREVEGVVIRAAANQGYTLVTSNFRKAFPLGFKTDKLLLSSQKGPLLAADAVTVRVGLMPLLTGDLSVAASLRIKGGSVEAEWSRRSGGTLNVNGIMLEDIPFFSTVAGATAKGALRITGNMSGKAPNRKGEVRLEVKGAELTGIKIGMTPLPDATYRQIQGMARIGGEKLTLESLTLQGDGFYARLKGDFPLTAPIAAAPLNMALELMPTAEFLEKQKFVFLLLAKYLVSPGNYRVPITGTLGSPSIQ